MLRRRCRLCNLVVLLLFVSLLLFSGCQQQNTDATDNQTTEITVTDDSGAELTLENNPERIVSLTPSNTEILFALGGGCGYVAWHGTQHNPSVARGENGVPLDGAGTLALIGDLKQMNPQWLRGVSYVGYGVSLAVGIGIPIPILNEEILRFCTVTDADIYATIVDYSTTYPQRDDGDLGRVSYAELRSGEIEIQGKKVPTTSLSSYLKARHIAQVLKDWIIEGDFLLTEPVQPLPSTDAGIMMNNLEEKRNNR
jgi:uncharacterized protein (DUF39 family)